MIRIDPLEFVRTNKLRLGGPPPEIGSGHPQPPLATAHAPVARTFSNEIKESGHCGHLGHQNQGISKGYRDCRRESAQSTDGGWDVCVHGRKSESIDLYSYRVATVAKVATPFENQGDNRGHPNSAGGHGGHAAPSFFQVFEDHGLDGLIPEDWNEATRRWLARRRTDGWSEVI